MRRRATPRGPRQAAGTVSLCRVTMMRSPPRAVALTDSATTPTPTARAITVATTRIVRIYRGIITELAAPRWTAAILRATAACGTVLAIAAEPVQTARGADVVAVPAPVRGCSGARPWRW